MGIEYVYDSTRIYFKPAFIISGIFAFFVALMTLSRISPSLEVPPGMETQNGDRVVIEQIMDMVADQGTAGKLDRLWKRIEDAAARSKVQGVAVEMKRVSAKLRKKQADAVEVKSNIGALLKGL